MVELAVDFNLAEYQRNVSDFVERQIPFATALALTRTAQDAQKALKEHLPHEFQIRSKWVQGGIRIRRANKRNLEAQVGSRDKFMALQAEGGEKRGKGAKDVAVPMGARKKPHMKTTRAKWPGRLLQKNRHFIATMESGKAGIFRRRTKKRFPIELMYSFERAVKVLPRYRQHIIVEAIVGKRWAPNAVAALERAVKTARR